MEARPSSSPASPRRDRVIVTDVRDPAEMDGRSRLLGRLPGEAGRVLTYTLRDPALRRARAGPLLARHADRFAGDVVLCHVAERFGTEIRTHDPGVSHYNFCLVRSGRFVLSAPDADGPVEAGPGRGVVMRGQAGTGVATEDGTARTGLWIAAARFEAALQACLGERPRGPLVFGAALDWTSPANAGLRRLLVHAAEELPRPGGLAANPPALAAFVDLFVHTALRGLPHSHAERLGRQRDGAAPACVRRAEDYFREHAAEAVRMEDAAAAAGCTVRSLQRGFRAFRDTTPHAALERARLELVRDELARGGGAGAASAVARRYGFTNAGRFAAAYARRFGEDPPGARRRSAARPRP